MLEILREKARGVIAWIIVLFIAVAFAFFGLGDYFLQSGSSETAAKVDDQKISWKAVDNIYRRVSPQYANQVDEKTLRNQILMQLIRRLALIKEIKTAGFRVADDQVAAILVNIPAFQVEGQFSKEQYLKTLAEANYSEIGFRQELLQDALLGQLEQGILQSSFTTQAELKSTVALVDQKRDFGYVIVPAKKYKKDIKVSPEQIKAYYKQHKANFVKPEQVVLEYVELSLSELTKEIKPTKEDVFAFYKAHEAAFTTPERVHAKHILIAAPEGDAAADQKAKAKIQEISQALKQGADFSVVAKNSSSDVGSAKNGGDLGWFVRGQMVPEFEKAAFALTKPGSLSEPIRTQFGYHLIQLVEHKASENRPFDKVKNLVEAQLKREKAEVLFAEKAEVLAKLGFEQPSLEPITKELDLKQQETAPFSREGGTGIASNPELVKMAFNESFLKAKHNSEPIRLSEDKLVVVRVKNHQPAVQQTLAEAQAQVSDVLALEAMRQQAKAVGEGLLKKIQQGAKPVEVAHQQDLNWQIKTHVIRSATAPNREIISAVFQIPEQDPASKTASFNGFSLPNGDYLVLALNKVHQGNWSTLPSDIQSAYRQGLIEFSSQLEYALYANEVLQAARVRLFKDPV
jgi:peptidyl-prolyl cis-trans isomerase D